MFASPFEDGFAFMGFSGSSSTPLETCIRGPFLGFVAPMVNSTVLQNLDYTTPHSSAAHLVSTRCIIPP